MKGIYHGHFFRQKYFVKKLNIMLAHTMKVAYNIFNPILNTKLCGDLIKV